MPRPASSLPSVLADAMVPLVLKNHASPKAYPPSSLKFLKRDSLLWLKSKDLYIKIQKDFHRDGRIKIFLLYSLLITPLKL